MRRLIPVALALATACTLPNQRYFYRAAIEQAADRLPRAGVKCWLTPDLTGPMQGSPAIAEEVFSNYLVEARLCSQVEKHPDAIAGYSWPQNEVCPCQPKQENCSGTCHEGGGASVPSLGFGGGGGGGGNDNNRSNDRLLERYKKAHIAQKLVVYRIDELQEKKVIVYFRVSDAPTGVVEQAFTVTIEVGGGGGATESGAEAPPPPPPSRRR